MKNAIALFFLAVCGSLLSGKAFGQQSTYQPQSLSEPVKVQPTAPDTSPVILYVPKKLSDLNTPVPENSGKKEEKIIVNEPHKVGEPK